MPEKTEKLKFIRNVSYQGTEYGPDYDSDTAEVDVWNAAKFKAQGRAVPAKAPAAEAPKKAPAKGKK